MIPVMIIEDEFLVRIGIKSCISWEEEGYEVVAEEEDGEEAVRSYHRLHPQLIITDIRLPHKNGLEVMKEIREQDKHVKFIIISAYDDFEIAREAISIGVEGYFLKGNLDPEEITKLLKLLKGTFRQQSEILQTKGEMSLKQIYQKLAVEDLIRSGWEMENGRELRFCILKVQDTDLKSFTQMIKSFLVQKQIKNSCGMEGDYIWFFATLAEKLWGTLLREMSEMLRRYVHAQVYIGVSDRIAEGTEIQDIIYEAILAVESCKADQALYKVYQANSADEFGTLRKMEETLKKGQFVTAKKQLEEVQKRYQTQYSVKGFEKFIYKLVGILADLGLEKPEMEYHRELMEMLDMDCIFRSLREQIEMLEKRSEEHVQENAYITRAMEYVQENYAKRINITKIAEDIHVSPNYLGKLFVNATGEYLTDFINRVRIEQAQSLLLNTRGSINEIAEKVGISDQRYFAKLFKKYCSISPKEYRKQIKIN